MSHVIDLALSSLLESSAKSILVAIVAAAILGGLRLQNQNLHHRTWLAVLVIMLTLPSLGLVAPTLSMPVLRTASSTLPHLGDHESSQRSPVSDEPRVATSPVVTQLSEDGPEIIGLPQLATSIPPLLTPANVGTQNEAIASTMVKQWQTWATWVFAIYIVGAAFALGRLLLGIRAVGQLVGNSNPISPANRDNSAAMRCSRAAVLSSEMIRVPLTVGFLKPVILLPTDWTSWSPEMLRAVLKHEQTHIDRRDYAVGILTELNRCLYWFHPLAWMLRKRLATLAEQVCDDLVITDLNDRTGYARYLLDVATILSQNPRRIISLAVPMSRTSILESRIDAVLDSNRPLAQRIGRRAGLALCAIGISTAMITAGLQAQQQPGTSPVSEPDSKTPETRLQELLLSKTVRVVNSDWQPVVGATITPWGMRSAKGSGLWSPASMGKSEPPVVTTNDQGIAIIPFPRYAIPEEKVRPESFTCRVQHRDYADSGNNIVPVTMDGLATAATIKMYPGALIEVSVRSQGQLLPAGELYAQWSEYSSEKLTADRAGRIMLPRISAGVRLIRLVSIRADGPALFSDTLQVLLADGDRRELEIEMKPGLTVQGQLDVSVPRPVKNGKVIARTVDIASADSPGATDGQFIYDRPATLGWQISTTVNANGSFTLNDVPPGNLQVIARCDGFYAASPETSPSFAKQNEPPQIIPRSRPQVFVVDERENKISLNMTPSVECKIRVTGPDQRPVPDAICAFKPEVLWWRGGSQRYCYPLFSTPESLRDPNLIKKMFSDPRSAPYSAITDSQGIAVVGGLPPRNLRFSVDHDDYEIPIGELNDRYGRVDLRVGEQASANISLQAIGSEFIGDRVQEPVNNFADIDEQADRVPILPPPKTDEQADHVRKLPPPKTFETEAADTEIVGVVIDESGAPIAGVNVDAWTWQPGHETTTDVQGRFRLTDFDHREPVEVQFSKDEYSPSYFVAKKAGTDNWTIVLTQGTWLEGNVISPTGKPVAGAIVRAKRGPFRNPQVQIDDVTTRTETLADGSYRLYLELGKYDVQVRVPGVGAARHSQINLDFKEKKSLDIRLDRGVTFRATVRDSMTREPVEGIVLWNWRQPEIEGVSDKSGRLEIAGMMEGEFEFSLTAANADRRRNRTPGNYARWWSPDVVNEYGRQQIPQGDQMQSNWDDLKFELRGDVYQVNVFVEPMVTIRGRVLDPNGSPVAGATVAPAKTGSGNSITGDTRFSYETDAKGRFTMKLPASKNTRYNLVAHDGKYQEWRNWSNGVGEPMQTVPGQNIQDVELRLTRPATVRGRVTNILGTPRAHVQVIASAFDKRDNRYYNPETTTDSDGRYELKFIRPGKHYVSYRQTGIVWSDTERHLLNLIPNAIQEEINFTID